MFGSRAPRAVMSAIAAIVLIVGLMAGTVAASRLPASSDSPAAAAKPRPTPSPTPTPTPTPTPEPTPTPTPNSDSRNVYFGDAPASDAGFGVLVLTPATVGNVFVFDVVAENRGNQTLTHAMFGLGGGAATWPEAPGGAPSLPDGVNILSATVTGATCSAPTTFPTTSFSCDIGNFTAGATAKVTYMLTATKPVPSTSIWASFKVAENTSGDSGANRNSFFAVSPISIGATNTDNNAGYIASGPFSLSTNVPTVVDDLLQLTTIHAGPNSNATGFISITETNDPTGCPTVACIGQEIAANVNGGASVSPYLVWEIQIQGQGAGANKGGVVHQLDSGIEVVIFNTNANKCSATKVFDCFEEYTVDKKTNQTTIIFRSITNGRTKAF